MSVLISAEKFRVHDMKSPPINLTISSFGSVECHVYAVLCISGWKTWKNGTKSWIIQAFEIWRKNWLFLIVHEIQKKSGLYVEKKTPHFSIFSFLAYDESLKINDKRCLPVRKLVIAHGVVHITSCSACAIASETEKFFFYVDIIT